MKLKFTKGVLIDMCNPDDPMIKYTNTNSDDTSLVYLVTNIPISNLQVLFLASILVRQINAKFKVDVDTPDRSTKIFLCSV